MNSKKWLKRLKRNLSGLSADEKKRIVEFYKEMIADRIEDGMTEAEALESLGMPEDVAQKIIDDGAPKKERERRERRQRKGPSVWAIIGLSFFWLIIGVPLFAVWVSIVAVVGSLALCGAALVACGAIVLPVSIIYIAWNVGSGLTLMGSAVVLIGLGAIFAVCFGYLIKYCIIFTKKLFTWTFKGVAL